ncbi:MAG: adenylyl-sulfate kinase [Opitutaceae bacterium]|nr:adenylyl-sulfate kinase [Opitutaceae bacterium]
MARPSSRNPSPPPATAGKFFWNESKVTPQLRAGRNRHVGRVLWFTGLPGSGKSTIATELERRLFQAGKSVFLLDGDNLRQGLCADLGFSTADRSENIRRAAEVAKLFADSGVICLAAFISPLRADREQTRRIMPAGRYAEIFVNAPLEVCKQRDPKGLYARAARGELPEFTGVSAPYEPPADSEINLHTDRESVETCVTRILDFLAKAEAGVESRGEPALLPLLH